MSQENVEAVHTVVDAFLRRDAPAAHRVMQPDVEWYPAYTGGGLLEANVYRGHEGFTRYLNDLSETWSTVEGHIDEVRDLGERVLLFGHVRTVGRGSGVDIDQPVSGVFTFRSGKIATARYYADPAEALKAVGLSE